MEKPPFQFGLKAVLAAILVAAMMATGLLRWPAMPPDWATRSPEMIVWWLAAVFLEFWLMAWLLGLLRYKPSRLPALQFSLKAVFAAMTGVAVLLAMWAAAPALLAAILALVITAAFSIGIVWFTIRLFSSGPHKPPDA